MKKRNIFLILIAVIAFAACSKSDSSSTGGGGESGSGKGGSMARFALAGDVLYVVSNNDLRVFDVAQSDKPRHLSGRDQDLGFGIETVFTMDTLLFVGSQRGMYIYDIKSPAFPTYLSKAEHLKSCDPVVAQGNYAYVTLNNVNYWCGGMVNALQIYDISNPVKPVMIRDIRGMKNPKGLGVDGNRLLVCDNILKMYDITIADNPRPISDLDDVPEIKGTEGYDVIPLGGTAIYVAKGGLYQLEYTGEKLKFVSKLEVQQ